MTAYLKLSENNSGGSWWTSDEDWETLERAGWIVHWHHSPDDTDHEHSEPVVEMSSWIKHNHAYIDDLIPCVRPQNPEDHRFLGALATSAAVTIGPDGVYPTPDAACDAFEILTNSNLDDSGCNCCGPPHSMVYHDEDGKESYFDSRPSLYKRSWS